MVSWANFWLTGSQATNVDFTGCGTAVEAGSLVIVGFSERWRNTAAPIPSAQTATKITAAIFGLLGASARKVASASAATRSDSSPVGSAWPAATSAAARTDAVASAV